MTKTCSLPVLLKSDTKLDLVGVLKFFTDKYPTIYGEYLMEACGGSSYERVSLFNSSKEKRRRVPDIRIDMCDGIAAVLAPKRKKSKPGELPWLAKVCLNNIRSVRFLEAGPDDNKKRRYYIEIVGASGMCARVYRECFSVFFLTEQELSR